MPRGKSVETIFFFRKLKTFHFLLIHIAFKIIALIEVPCFVSVKAGIISRYCAQQTTTRVTDKNKLNINIYTHLYALIHVLYQSFAINSDLFTYKYKTESPPDMQNKESPVYKAIPVSRIDSIPCMPCNFIYVYTVKFLFRILFKIYIFNYFKYKCDSLNTISNTLDGFIYVRSEWIRVQTV